MAKKTGTSKGRKRTVAKRKSGSPVRSSARKNSARKFAKPQRKTGRKTAKAKTPTRKAAKKTAKKTAAPARRTVKKAVRKPVRKARAGRSAKLTAGGTGRESELAQTPKSGRTVKGRTNPMPTRRSTGTGSGAGDARRIPGLERARRQLREVEEHMAMPPSSLDLDRRPSAARSGRHELQESRLEHTETSPVLTGGDVDASWKDAYAVGDEAPGGDNPTPDQDRVDDIGKALGVEYQDNEELKGADKIAARDRKRWELDPASAEDYRDHDKDE